MMKIGWAMIRTHGLTHIALAVRDVDRAASFYGQVFGAVEVYRKDGFVQMQTPGTRDVLVFERSDTSDAGRSGGIAHFGFRLLSPRDIDRAARSIVRAGGTIKSQGEFCPGEPYIFAADPDGYEIEVWYELPTPVDPPQVPSRAASRRRRAQKRRRDALHEKERP
jgi:catechol 2,3-dioxygenase-like lactoylglutathione lyase family enzyme